MPHLRGGPQRGEAKTMAPPPSFFNQLSQNTISRLSLSLWPISINPSAHGGVSLHLVAPRDGHVTPRETSSSPERTGVIASLDLHSPPPHCVYVVTALSR